MQGKRGAGLPTGAALIVAFVLLVSAPSASAVDVGHFRYIEHKEPVPAAVGMAETTGESKAVCGSKKWKLASGGANISGEAGDSFLASTGIGGHRAWYANAWHTSEPEAKLTSHVVCARKAHVVRDIGITILGAAPGDGANVFNCPTGDIVGVGARGIGATTDWFVNSVYPIDDVSDGDTKPDNANQTYMRHRAGPSESFLTDILCVTSEAPSYESSDVVLGTGQADKVKATCNSGHVVGGGALISGTVADAHLTGTYPVDGGDPDNAPDDGWEARGSNDGGSAKTLTVYAICL